MQHLNMYQFFHEQSFSQAFYVIPTISISVLYLQERTRLREVDDLPKARIRVSY